MKILNTIIKTKQFKCILMKTSKIILQRNLNYLLTHILKLDNSKINLL